VRASFVVILLYGGFLGLTWLGFNAVPNGFVPMQDKYYLVGIAQLPTGASLERTEAVVKEMSKVALAEPGVESVVAFPGMSVNGGANLPNAALMFVMLDSFETRKDPSLSAHAIAGKLMGKYSQIPDGFIGVFPPPPVPGLGTMGGFKLQIEDRAGLGFEALAQATEAAPDIQLPGRYDRVHLVGFFIIEQAVRKLLLHTLRGNTEIGQDVRSAYPVVGTRHFDVQGRNTQVPVILKRDLDKVPQQRVLKKGLPANFGDRTFAEGTSPYA